MFPPVIGVLGILLALGCIFAAACTAAIHNSRRSKRPVQMDRILSSLSRIEVKRLKLLVDPMEEAFLRESSSRSQFCEMQRDRIESALQYFKRMGRNAAVLQALGYRNLNHSNATQRYVARQLVEAAVPVRMYTTTGAVVLRLWRLARFQRFILLSPNLSDLRELVAQLLTAYDDLKQVTSDMLALSNPEMHRDIFRNL